MEIKINATVDAADIANSFSSHKELVAFIVEIDREVADWPFTLMLYERFAKLKAEYDAIIAEDAKFWAAK